MIQTPDATRDPNGVDELADAIRLSGARESTGVRVEAGGAWGLQAGASPHATLHVMVAGEAWVTVREHASQHLRAGDVMWLPANAEHSLAACPGLTLAPCNHTSATHALRSGRTMRVGHPPVQSRLLTLHYTQDSEVSSPALLALSSPMHLSARKNPGLTAISRLIDAELAQPQAGTTAAVNSMVDLLLVHLIRSALARRPDDAEPALLDARLDPITRDAVSLMHREPHRDWTADSLAAAIGISRASLTRHFTVAIGMTPAAYLTRWRMDLAASRLRDTEEPVGMIARAVGYASPRAFARAFQRSRAQSPSQYRHHSHEREGGVRQDTDAPMTPGRQADTGLEATT